LAEETLPTSIKQEETRRLKRAISPLHHKAGARRASGDWRVAGSIWLQKLALGITLVFNSASSG